jgi:hypothetical protein
MKTKILAGLFIVLAAGFIPVLADDNPDQAAARAALVKKLFELSQPPLRPPPRWDSGAVAVSPDKSTNEIIEPVATKTEPPQTTPAATNLLAAPAKEVPAAVTPAVAAKIIAEPTKTQPPAAAVPATPKANLPPVVIKAPNPPVKLPPANDLVTITGAVYKEARVEKVEPDGLIISYVPARGGVAMTKVLFEDLPDQLRQQYEKKKEIKH